MSDPYLDFSDKNNYSDIQVNVFHVKNSLRGLTPSERENILHGECYIFNPKDNKNPRVPDINCKGKIILAGIGKSGLIARKISATFSSVGIPSFFCDPAQALHGDMGQIEKKDILIIFSYSGNTLELTNMLSYANRYRIKIIGVASKPNSILLKASDIKLLVPEVKESDITGMVPTSSTSITLLLGDCLATTVMQLKNFSREKFKVFHPGGNIGKTLLLAKDIMVSGKKMPTISYKKNLKEALKIMNQKKN